MYLFIIKPFRERERITIPLSYAKRLNKHIMIHGVSTLIFYKLNFKKNLFKGNKNEYKKI